MRHPDFVSFCTTLKPPELRAVGELSWVRHLDAGAILYTSGEPGNALYIINRGVLEILPQTSQPSARSFFLTRGDIVGHVEAFLEIPRAQLVRAHEPASLQCFPRANFPELLRLVPSFYRYLCAQMAYRSFAERDLAREENPSLELSGCISNFDIATIHQTIVSSGQTGELQLQDENGEPFGTFYFESGRLRAGKFQHLSGEEAFWQLFLSDNLSATFSFSVGQRPLTNWIESGQIKRSGGEMLITALQFRDELDGLKKEMPHHDSDPLTAKAAELHWPQEAPHELKEVAQQVLAVLSGQAKKMAELYRQSSVCELKLYQVVRTLMDSDHVSFTAQGGRPSGQASAPTMNAEAKYPSFAAP